MKAKPVLKWAGGKRRLLEQYSPFLPTEFGSYFEPFIGGGALFFSLFSQGLLSDKKAAINDINPELVNFYQVLKTDCDNLIKKLSEHEKKHDEQHYYDVRAKNFRRMNAVNRAARLLYMNRTCFNGLYRVNSKGQFNVPMGRYKNPLICDRDGLKNASRALQQTSISQGNYRTATQSAKEGDFVYFDPPYVPLNTTSNFTSYTRENFTLDDQKDLAQTFRELAERGVKVLLSNSDTAIVRELYHDFTLHKVMAPRAINSKANKRQSVSELLIAP